MFSGSLFPMKRIIGLVFGSLVGACVLHFVLAACGSGSTPNALAQSSCTSWQVAGYYAPAVLSTPSGSDWPTGLTTPVNLPSGWEPLEASPFGGMSGSGTNTVGAFVIVRHCVQ